MIPVFEAGMKAALVERMDSKGALGVAVPGGAFVCPLPPGYDGYTCVSVDDEGWVLVIHPTLPPLLADPTTGEVHPIARFSRRIDNHVKRIERAMRRH